MRRARVFITFVIVLTCFGEIYAAVWQEDFSEVNRIKQFQVGKLQLDSDASNITIKNGTLKILSRGTAAKASLTAKINNTDYNLSLDIFLLKDADEGYARYISYTTKSGSPWLITFRPKGDIYFYTADARQANARSRWAVRGHTKIAYGKWYRIAVKNHSNQTQVKIRERVSGKVIWKRSARHNTGGWGLIEFGASGKNMGMLIDNTKLAYRDKDMKVLSVPPGVKELIDVWAPATTVTAYKNIIRKRQKGIGADPVKCWMADMAVRDGQQQIQPKFYDEGKFSRAQSGDTIYFCNQKAGYAIRKNSLWSMYDFGARMECISKGRIDVPLWEITLRSSDGKNKSVVKPDAAPAVKFDVTNSKLAIRLTWEKLRAKGISGMLDVEAVGTLPADDSVVRWRINVTNHLQRAGLWRVFFPVIGNPGYAGESDVCSGTLRNPHQGLGDLMRRCDGPLSHTYMGKLVERKYPGTGVQLMSISCGPATAIYIACCDGDGYSKGWGGSLNDKFEIFAYPEGTAQPGINYSQSYDILLGPMRGDWFDAAKRYRKWALKQKWCKAGPIAARNIPEKFKQIDFVIRTSLWGDPGPEKWNKDKGVWELTEDGKKWKNACGTIKSKYPAMMGHSPVEQTEKQRELYLTDNSYLAVHTYMWHQNFFDDMYPDFLPAIKGFRKLVADWQSKKMIVMPYINGWLLDKRVPWFEQAKPYLARKIDGGTYDGKMRNNTSPVTTPCVYTKFWRDKIAHLAKVICSDIGCDGLYIDQTAGMPPVLCFDKHHGHPIGGGKWFGESQRKLFKEARKAAGKPIWLSSEWFCEYYIDVVDDFLLIWSTHGLDNAPLLPVIYGGYTGYHGSRIESQDDRDTIKLVFGRTLLWGSKFGHIICLNDVLKGVAPYIQNLVQLRSRIRKFVQFGEMLRPPKILSIVPRQTLNKWEGAYGMHKVIAPVLERSLWRAPDGSLGLIVANYSDKQQRVKFDSTFIGDDFTHLKIIHHDGIRSEQKIKQGQPLSVLLPPEQAVAVEIFNKGK